jgi:hypothetical protein
MRSTCRRHLPGPRVDDVEGSSELVGQARCKASDRGEAVGVPELRERPHLRIGLSLLALVGRLETLTHPVHFLRKLGNLVTAAGRNAIREIPLTDAASLRHELRERSTDQHESKR